MKKTVMWIGVGLASLLVLFCVFGTVLAVVADKEKDKPQPKPSASASKATLPPTPARTTTGPITKAPEPVKTTKPPAPRPATYGPGMYEVGTDIPAGKYRSKGMSPNDFMCYWHTASDETDNTIKTQGVANKVNEPQLVTLKKGEFFNTSGCADWVKR